MSDVNAVIDSNHPRQAPAINISTDVILRKGVGIMLLVVITSSAILSWSGLVKLAEMAGMTGYTAYMLPISIDGALLLGSLLQLHGAFGKREASFGNLLALFGVVLSIGGNMYSSQALDWVWVTTSVHAIAPIMLFMSLLGFERIIRHRIVAEATDLKKKQRNTVVRNRTDEANQGQKAPQRVVSKAPIARHVAPKAITSTDSSPAISIESLQSVISLMGDETTKADKVDAMLSLYPNSTNAELSAALGVPVKQVATTISRVRKRKSGEAEIDAGVASLETRSEAASAVLPA